MDMNDVRKDRMSLKGKFVWLEKSGVETDQMKGLPKPSILKEYTGSEKPIQLPSPDQVVLFENDITKIIDQRKSRRNYIEKEISQEELSFLLWATQGIKEVGPNSSFIRRTVPSGGARHTFETYLAIHQVAGIEPGIYQYIPQSHSLGLLFKDPNLTENCMKVGKGQSFVGKCAVTFIWSCIPYRSEYRYHWESHKLILQDAGHMCQNLYLAVEAIHAGTCAIGAYDQDFSDHYLGLDGNDEFVIYVAPIGKYE
jgi:SagB-type dehydrogenase family enzyme